MKKTKATRYIYTVPYMKSDGVFEKVAGYDVEILPWASTFIAKRHDSWTVFEITTGKNIAGGTTISAAIAAAKTQLEIYGKKIFKQAIDRAQKVPTE